MKTTIDLPDELVEKARRTARREKTTLRALLTEGLRLALRRRHEGVPTFRLRDATFEGRGVQPGVAEGDWSRILELSYEGRGG